MDVMNLGDYDEAMKTHFWGPLYATLAVLPGMKRRGGGRIVNPIGREPRRPPAR